MTQIWERERPFFACYAAPLYEDGISLRLLGDSNDASLWWPFHLLYCTLLIDGPIQNHQAAKRCGEGSTPEKVM